MTAFLFDSEPPLKSFGPRARRIARSVFVVWLLAILGGFAYLSRYHNQPGPAAESPALWPPGSRVEEASERFHLLIWLHPRCPCSFSSIGQAERLLSTFADKTTCTVLVALPATRDRRFTETSLVRRAKSMPNTRWLFDDLGREANRFGVQTSGHVLLYGPDGRLRFSGGITPRRGHEGVCAGTLAIEKLLAGGAPEAIGSSPVFGCRLARPSDESGTTP